MTNPKLGKFISVATAILTLLSGIALIICAAHLFYTGGDKPYTRERVGDYLSYLIIPAVITVILIIAGKVYDVLAKAKSNDKVRRSELDMLYGYAKRFNLDELDEDIKKSVLLERKKRLAINVICHSVSALFGICAVLYLAFFAEFTVENLTGDVMRAFGVALPIAALAVAAQIPRLYLCEAGAKREREYLLNAVKAGYTPAPVAPETEAASEQRRAIIIRYVILGAAVLFIILGVFNGGMADVLAKAVKICTECIGLG